MAREDAAATLAIDRLRAKAKLNKDRHFAAAERKSFYQVWVGLPVILINIFVGTVLVKFLQPEAPPVWASVLATALAFLAASLSSVQTFFNFGRVAEGHRSVANRYLFIAMQCEHLLAKICDLQISLSKVWEQLDELTANYDQINIEAEAFTTSKRDFSQAAKKDSLVPYASPTEEAIRRAESEGAGDGNGSVASGDVMASN